MGTQVHYKNSSYSMRNVNEDSNSSNWHLFNTLTNSHYYDGFTPRTVTDAYLGHDKDGLKQKMLQHEAVFKNQVYELHRIYRRQTDMMEEVKRKEFHKYQISIDTASSSSLVPSQKPYDDDVNRWQNPSFPLANSTSRPSIFNNSPLSCSKGNGSKDCEIVECRPLQVRKKLFDLQLPAHEYIRPEESKRVLDNQTSEILSYNTKENGFVPKNEVKTFLDDGGKKDGYKNNVSSQLFMRSNGLADLNEPVYGQDVDSLGPSAKQVGFSNLPFESKSSGRDRISSCMWEPGNSRSNMIPSHTMHAKEVQFNQTRLLFSPSSNYPFGNSGSHSGPSWGKSNDGLTHKLTSFQTHQSFLSTPRNNEVFKDKRQRNGNGFHNGSSSGLTSIGLDYRNCNNVDNGCQKIFKGSNFVDLTDNTKCMDLNTVQTLSKEDKNSKKCDKNVLPWLKAKPVVSKNGNISCDVLKEKDDNSGTNKKLLGCPIFRKFCISKNDASIKHRGIDINVALDDVSASEHIDVETDEEIKNFKNNFDLNSCVTEDDDLLTEYVKSSNKMTMEIDLERPPVSEIEEEDEHKETEFEKIAAEAIIAISSQQNHVGSASHATSDNDNDSEIENKNYPLLWFVKVINSCEKKIVSAIRETDEYEMLTLKLEETKEEEYMPAPLVPDFQEPDEVGPALTSSRPRRGQARRGRPRRDFQRDILPSMSSLSRHDITEDLQVFGGLMRATGHFWNFGSAKRNGKRIGARGRQKVKAAEITPFATSPPSPPLPAKQVNKVEMVRLDERSLTGWGKTTRRPRRQRCAAGNSVAVQLT